MKTPDPASECPGCGKHVRPGEHFPFCSMVCRAEDLYQWLDGSFERQLLGEPEDDEAFGP